MPEKGKAFIAELMRTNPSWEVLVWGPDESRALIATHYPSFVHLYDNFEHPIQRSDFSRYAILYHFGGVYMDMDYRVKKPLDDIMEYVLRTQPGKVSFVNESPNNFLMRRLSNSFMIAAVPKHDWWMHVMNTASNGVGLTPHVKVLSSTGPQMIDKAYSTYNNLNRAQVGILPMAVFNPCGVCCLGTSCSKGDGVLAVHKHAGAWNQNASLVYNKMLCQKWWILAVFFLSVAFIIALVYAVLYSRRRAVQGK